MTPEIRVEVLATMQKEVAKELNTLFAKWFATNQDSLIELPYDAIMGQFGEHLAERESYEAWVGGQELMEAE